VRTRVPTFISASPIPSSAIWSRAFRSWTKPWTTTSKDSDTIRPLRHDGTPYRGINVLILWSEAVEHGYASPTWMTYRQAQALGAQVRKGEHGATVVYAKTIERAEDDAVTSDETVTRIPMLRAYTVFTTPIRSMACRRRHRLSRLRSQRGPCPSGLSAPTPSSPATGGDHRAQGQPRLLYSVRRSHRNAA